MHCHKTLRCVDDQSAVRKFTYQRPTYLFTCTTLGSQQISTLMYNQKTPSTEPQGGLIQTDQVLGHSILQGTAWLSDLQESSSLLKAIVSDASAPIETLIQGKDSSGSFLNAFRLLLYWDSGPGDGKNQQEPNPAVNFKHRTLLMLAAFFGSVRVLALLLSLGADPNIQAPDGPTVYDFAIESSSPNKATVLGMLRDAEPKGDVEGPRLMSSSDDVVCAPSVHSQIALEPGDTFQMVQGVAESSILGPDASSRELMRPEYSTDTFRMFCFKVLRCSKTYTHDWRSCPFAHPTENARRRDPREFQYATVACPDYKRGLCMRGDSCPYAHGIFERW